jgi:hypothetical protein
MDDNQFGQSQEINGALNGVSLLCNVYEGKFGEEKNSSNWNSSR